jgi:hypothetical protein
MKRAIHLTVLLAFLLAGNVLAQKPELKFNADNKFKIVQFTDTHIKPGDPLSDVVFTTVAKVLDAEKPDLVVLTGDIVTGRPAQKGWEAITELIIRRKIPFAAVFGNHDDEHDLTRAQLAELIEKMPFSLMIGKTGNVSGYGNYVIQVRSSDGKSTAENLYFMDSNAYTTIEGVGKYGWFHNDQIQWFRDQSRQIRKANGGKTIPALAFFHIPFPEYTQAYRNEKNPAIGVRLETEAAPTLNSGMFAAMLESGDVTATFVGHDHINDYVSYLYGIALCYGRFTGGKTTYGDLPNGGRVIELTEGNRAFKTWIRTGEGEVLLPVNFPEDLLPKK